MPIGCWRWEGPSVPPRIKRVFTQHSMQIRTVLLGGHIVTSHDGHDVIRLLPLQDDVTPPGLARAPSGAPWRAGAGDQGAGGPRGRRDPRHVRPRPQPRPAPLGSQWEHWPKSFSIGWLPGMQMRRNVTSWDKSSAIFSFWLWMRSGWRPKGGRGAAGAARGG